MKSRYIKISQGGTSLHLTPCEAMELISDLVCQNDRTIYELTLVEMTKEEFDSIPEFLGF